MKYHSKLHQNLKFSYHLQGIFLSLHLNDLLLKQLHNTSYTMLFVDLQVYTFNSFNIIKIYLLVFFMLLFNHHQFINKIFLC